MRTDSFFHIKRDKTFAEGMNESVVNVANFPYFLKIFCWKNKCSQ